MSKKEFTVNDQDWAHELEKGVETYTDMLFEAVWDYGGGEVTETLSEEPFCGCSNCFWRETLFFLVPKIIKGYEEGKIELEE
jgi:hypothetical protein